MAFKEWFQKMRPMQLYIMLFITSVYFIVTIMISHITHSLTLLLVSYHMMCNIIALTGCIFTIKKFHQQGTDDDSIPDDTGIGQLADEKPDKTHRHKHELTVQQSEKSLKNTFGWARIDILVMLIENIFLASFCFSIVVEAMQTLFHIDHQDEMHYPVLVFWAGTSGLLLNGFCYLLIGGYTFHQGSYLKVTPSGAVILEKAVTLDSLRKGQRRLSAQSRRAEPSPPSSPPVRQSLREMMRDVIDCLFVSLCALVIYFMSGYEITKCIDPIISIISVVCLLVLSYPYMKEACLILLQTIPNDINIDMLKSELLTSFPDILNIHDFHVWQLTADRIVSTAHFIFLQPANYEKIEKQIKEFFEERGITQVTIQTEFTVRSKKESLEMILKAQNQPCLMPCLTEDCRRRHCCASEEDIPSRLDAVVVKTPTQPEQTKEIVPTSENDIVNVKP